MFATAFFILMLLVLLLALPAVISSILNGGLQKERAIWILGYCTITLFFFMVYVFSAMYDMQSIERNRLYPATLMFVWFILIPSLPIVIYQYARHTLSGTWKFVYYAVFEICIFSVWSIFLI